jgi:hypothetical protein
MKCPDCGYDKCTQVGIIRVPATFEVRKDAPVCCRPGSDHHVGMDLFYYWACNKCNMAFLDKPYKPPCEYCGYCKKAKEMYEMRKQNEIQAQK